MRGAMSADNAVELLILVFVAIVVIYQLIPQISNSNSTVQASGNVTTMGKFAAGLGEWLFPLGYCSHSIPAFQARSWWAFESMTLL